MIRKIHQAAAGLNWRCLASAVVMGAVCVLVVTAMASAGRSRSGAWSVSVVASGLDAPRGLALLSDGTLLVTEAGHAGDVCRPDSERGQAFTHCLGTSSQISKIDLGSGAHTPIISGLFSSATLGVVGIDGIAAQSGRKPGSTTGKLFALVGEAPQPYDDWSCSNQPADCSAVLATARAQAGQLIEFTTSGTWKPVAGVGASNYDWTRTNHTLSPELHANPYGVLPLLRGTWIVDGGANTLNWIPAAGGNVIASGIPRHFPAPGYPADGVPTCVTIVRGNLYAADLAGRFWKRNGSFNPTQLPVAETSGASLIHHVTGCTADVDGNFYFVDMWGLPGPPVQTGPTSAANTGSVVELAKDGTASVLASGLNFPNGIAHAPDGSLYVSVGSTCPASGSPFPYCAKGGQVVKLSRG
jgi:hypothetical protein